MLKINKIRTQNSRKILLTGRDADNELTMNKLSGQGVTDWEVTTGEQEVR